MGVSDEEGGGATGAADESGETSGAGGQPVLDVVGVRVELPSQQPIVLLKESDGERYLPIWIGAVEATAIAFAQQGVVTARPMTHDLLRDVLEELGTPLRSVTITALRDGVFYAELGFDGGRTVSARPSDAIALAMRTGTVIRGEEAVLAAAGIALDGEGQVAGATAGTPGAPAAEDEVERFREFLDTINPEDFERGAS